MKRPIKRKFDEAFVEMKVAEARLWAMRACSEFTQDEINRAAQDFCVALSNERDACCAWFSECTR